MTAPLHLAALTIICAACLAFMVGCARGSGSTKDDDSSRGQSSKKQSGKGKKKAKDAADESPADASGETAGVYAEPVEVGVLEEREVVESSGMVASRRNPGLFWTHNDSGDGAYLYAFDRAGRRRGVWRVEGAQAYDWEDIAAGSGPERAVSYLYVGDIGDNKRRRAEIVVYRFAEPDVAADAGGDSSRSNTRATERAEAIRLKYPDGAHDAEALLVHPSSGDIYVVTKQPSTVADVYKAAAPLDASRVTTLQRVGKVALPGFFGGAITGGDISPDGRRVILCNYAGGYELSLDDAGGAEISFDAIWEMSPEFVNLGARRQGEAVCYDLEGKSLFATSEKRHSPLFKVRRKE